MFVTSRKDIREPAKEWRGGSSRVNLMQPREGEGAEGGTVISERVDKNAFTRMEGGPGFIGGGKHGQQVRWRVVFNGLSKRPFVGVAAVDDIGRELVNHDQEVDA